MSLHTRGSSCAKAVACAFARETGMDEGLTHRLASTLGAGFGRKQYLCGALSGGALVLGLLYGNTEPEDAPGKERAYSIVNTYLTEMEERLGSSSCRELLGVSIATAREREDAKASGVFTRVCANAIRESAAWLEKHMESIQARQHG